jgi:hypothetical protein
VQGIWDIFGRMYPEIAEMQKHLSGVEPDKVEARPVDTQFGTMQGGYYPVIYDPTRSYRAAQNLAKVSDKSIFENNYGRATTPKGHTKDRTDYAAPIHLSIDNIPWKLSQAVHDLYFREAIMNAWKFMNDKDIRTGIERTLGREYYEQFPKWLQAVANDRNIDTHNMAAMDKFLRGLRTNTMIVGIGFRLSTMLKHGFSALSNSFGELGPKWMLAGSRDLFGDMARGGRLWDDIISKSGEMRNRMNEIDRDVRDKLRDMLADDIFTEGGTKHRLLSLQQSAAHYGHLGVGWLDMLSAMPTWQGAYKKALSEGMGEDQAIYSADKTVRKAHGAQSILDQAQVQRGGEIQKLFTMFYGFFNHIYNRQRDTVRIGARGLDAFKDGNFSDAKRDFGLVLARSFYYLVVPALVEAMATEGGPDDDKDETWMGWAAKAVAGEIPAGIPIMRDIAKAAISGRDYELSPVGKAVQSGQKLMKDMGSLWDDDKGEPSHWVKHAIETPGYIFGLPTGQLSNTAQYLYDVLEGKQDPEDAKEFMQGVVFGTHKKN